MSFAERFITRNGNRKLKNMRCPMCDKLMLGPLSRYVMDFSKRKLSLICPACHQPFEVEATEIKYEA